MGLLARKGFSYYNRHAFDFLLTLFLSTLVDYICKPPEVRINLNKTMENARNVTTIESLSLHGDVVIHCRNTNDTMFSWDVSTVDNTNKQFLPFITLADNVKKITIGPRKLSLGFHYIRFVAEMRREEGTRAYDYGYIRIVLPDLEPIVSGPSSIVKGSGLMVLNGEKSFDPNVDGPSRYQGLNFTWYCRRENEDYSNISSLPVNLPMGRSRDKGGCFGLGPGRLSTRTKQLILDPAEMKAKLHYVVDLVVNKGERTSRFGSHRFYVISALQFFIK